MLESDCDRRVAMAKCGLGAKGARTPRPTHGNGTRTINSKCVTRFMWVKCLTLYSMQVRFVSIKSIA